MSWIEVAFELEASKIEAGINLLEEAGALAISIYDAKDSPIFEPPPKSEPILWPYSILVGLFNAEFPVHTLLDSVAAIFPTASAKVRNVRDQNWVAICQAHFPATRFGNLWICPSWANKPTDPSSLCLNLDPGMAFGTGSHATTALCLQWISQTHFQTKKVLDYGCGSGILALACALSGALRVWGVDYDAQALASSKTNQANNKIPETQLSFHEPEDTTVQSIQVDILIANILVTPLVELKPTFSRLLKPYGTLVLSGILANQQEIIESAYSDAFDFIEKTSKEDWICLVAQKK
ncbi:MAG TPA: 50S ribosomal protein L11 methyltransferase [Gammaproteobacteria bacterium]|nr:50S ribosomal protein L11 methyltransferase [Gammaproteobacteria bacterium]